MRFRSTCEEGNSRNRAYRLRKIRAYLDSVYLASRVHVCWLCLLSYVSRFQEYRAFVWTFFSYHMRCVSESLDTCSCVDRA